MRGVCIILNIEKRAKLYFMDECRGFDSEVGLMGYGLFSFSKAIEAAC